MVTVENAGDFVVCNCILMTKQWNMTLRNSCHMKMVICDIRSWHFPFLQILPTAAFPFSHSGFTIWISQTVYFTSEHIRLFTF